VLFDVRIGEQVRNGEGVVSQPVGALKICIQHAELQMCKLGRLRNAVLIGSAKIEIGLDHRLEIQFVKPVTEMTAEEIHPLIDSRAR